MKTKIVDTAAATGKFLAKRSICRASASSARKLIRADRIRQGQRPRVTSNRFTVAEYANLPAGSSWQAHLWLHWLAHRAGLESPTVGTFARLHPTKGFRFGNAI